MQDVRVISDAKNHAIFLSVKKQEGKYKYEMMIMKKDSSKNIEKSFFLDNRSDSFYFNDNFLAFTSKFDESPYIFLIDYKKEPICVRAYDMESIVDKYGMNIYLTVSTVQSPQRKWHQNQWETEGNSIFLFLGENEKVKKNVIWVFDAEKTKSYIYSKDKHEQGKFFQTKHPEKFVIKCIP